MSKVQVRGYRRAVPKPKQRYGQGGQIDSFNQIGSDAPEYLSSAGAQRSSPQEYLQSGVESFNAEQNWRQGHQLTGMQKERVSEERGQLQDAGKYLGINAGLGSARPPMDSGPGGAKPPAPPQEDPMAQPLSFQQPRPRPSVLGAGLGLGQSSLLGMAKGGKVPPPPDLRKGGPVAGGPPGIDTVPAVIDGKAPAALDNGEYVLPPATVAALGGKAILDNLVLSTTGQEPVGYDQAPVPPMTQGYDQAPVPPPPPPQGMASGGQVSGWTAGQNRVRQIDGAVDSAMGQAQPPPAPPNQPMPPTETEKPRGMADIMREIRAKHPPVQGYQQGGNVQGYRVGGLTDEELMAQSPPYAKGPQTMTDTGYSVDAMGRGRQPLPMTEDSRFIPTADTAGSKSNRAWAQTRAEHDPAVTQAVAAQLQANQRGPVTPTGIVGANMNRGSAPAAPSPRDPRVPAAGVVPADPRPGSIGSRVVTGALTALGSIVPEVSAEDRQDYMDRTRQSTPNSGLKNGAAGMTGGPVPPPRQVQPPAAAPAQAQAATQAAAAPPSPLQQGIMAPSMPHGAPTAGHLRRSTLGLTPDAFSPTGPGYLGTVGGAPQGVTDAAYAAMSLPEKSSAKVKSMEDAAAAIRSARNARREAEGSPPVGGWKRYLLDQQLKAQGAEANQDLLKVAYAQAARTSGNMTEKQAERAATAQTRAIEAVTKLVPAAKTADGQDDATAQTAVLSLAQDMSTAFGGDIEKAVSHVAKYARYVRPRYLVEQDADIAKLPAGQARETAINQRIQESIEAAKSEALKAMIPPQHGLQAPPAPPR